MMLMYNLIEYNSNYAKKSCLWQYNKDIPYDNITNSDSFKFKARITGRTPAYGNTKNVEMVVPLKYLSNLWRALEISLIICKINLQITWSANCIITNSTGGETFAITNTRLYVPVVTLSTQDNTKLLQRVNSGFERTVN